MATHRDASLHGTCDPAFHAVGEEFARNFAERGEVGAALAIYVEGSLVVDLWGGSRAADRDDPWQRDTLVQVFSATKGMSATCLHVLIDRGMLDVDAPVAAYWPEFAANGKGDITVAMALAHQAGVPFWDADVPRDGLLDWGLATRLLAAQAPIWEPGTSHGYHGMTSGFIWGEICRRITGRTIGTFLREEVAEPLGADVWLGLPDAEEDRVAPILLAEFDPNSRLFAKAVAEPDWVGSRMLSNCGGLFDADMINTRAFRAAEGPATSGVASARGLARLYAPLSLDGSIDGTRIVGPLAQARMRAVRSAASIDQMLRIATSFTLGYSQTWGDRRLGAGNYMVLGEDAFGTPGMGGSIGFADGRAKLSFGYVMNQLGGGVALNPRGQSLIDATYRTLGFTSDAAGFWAR